MFSLQSLRQLVPGTLRNTPSGSVLIRSIILQMHSLIMALICSTWFRNGLMCCVQVGSVVYATPACSAGHQAVPDFLHEKGEFFFFIHLKLNALQLLIASYTLIVYC